MNEHPNRTKRRKANCIATFCIEASFYNTLFKGKMGGREDEEEDVRSCWMILRNSDYIGMCKSKDLIALCGEMVLEDAMDQS